MDFAETQDEEQNKGWKEPIISKRSELQESMRDKKDWEILESVNQIPFWVMQTFAWTIPPWIMSLLEVICTGCGAYI